MTHIKIGQFDSPLVCEGDANLLLAFDPTEAHRRLPYLGRADAGERVACVVNAANIGIFPDARVADQLAQLNVEVHVCPADKVALELKSPMLANLVLLGFCVARDSIPFSIDELREVTAAMSSRQHRELNLAALARGHSM